MDPRAERVCLDVRRHGAVLVPALLRAVALSVGGALLLPLPWPFLVFGPALMAGGAVQALVAVWRWDRTRLVVTTEKVFLVHGTVRKRASAVMLRSLRLVALEQTLLGRLLGYGTLVAGPLQVDYVPKPGRVRDLVEKLGKQGHRWGQVLH